MDARWIISDARAPEDLFDSTDLQVATWEITHNRVTRHFVSATATAAALKILGIKFTFIRPSFLRFCFLLSFPFSNATTTGRETHVIIPAHTLKGNIENEFSEPVLSRGRTKRKRRLKWKLPCPPLTLRDDLWWRSCPPQAGPGNPILIPTAQIIHPNGTHAEECTYHIQRAHRHNCNHEPNRRSCCDI